jgi:hypothetical protein
MNGTSRYVKASTLVFTVTYDSSGNLIVMGKRDQVWPDLVRPGDDERRRKAYLKWKRLATALKTGGVPPGIAHGATAQLGVWVAHESYSDDSGYAVVSKDFILGDYVASFLPEYFPTAGGGVPGSTSYRGAGWRVKGPTEWVWNDYSFGIGD